MNYTKGVWMAQFTPVPNKQQWEVVARTDHPLLLLIASIDSRLDFNEASGNANLIAAAPDMYEALKEILTYDKIEYFKAAWTQALTKAEGKEER